MAKKAQLKIVEPVEPQPVKLELNHDNIEAVRGAWEQEDDSLDEVAVVNLIQFLTPAERIHFVNELHRVMKPGAKAQIVAPHWCSARAWGDMAFVHPPVAETWFCHLNAEWRKSQAPWGTGYTCDFDHTLGYGLHPAIVPRNQEYQMHAVGFWKEAAQDLMATLIKR